MKGNFERKAEKKRRRKTKKKKINSRSIRIRLSKFR